MESPKHVVIASQLIYKFERLEIYLKTCESLVNNSVFLCLTRRKIKSDDLCGWPSSEYSFFFPREVGCKLLEELPATIDFIQHVLTKEVKSPSEGHFTTICERLLTSNEKKEYYLGVKQSNLYGSYQVYLSRHNHYVQPTKVSDFSLTVPAARAILSYLPHILHCRRRPSGDSNCHGAYDDSTRTCYE